MPVERANARKSHLSSVKPPGCMPGARPGASAIRGCADSGELVDTAGGGAQGWNRCAGAPGGRAPPQEGLESLRRPGIPGRLRRGTSQHTARWRGHSPRGRPCPSPVSASPPLCTGHLSQPVPVECLLQRGEERHQRRESAQGKDLRCHDRAQTRLSSPPRSRTWWCPVQEYQGGAVEEDHCPHVYNEVDPPLGGGVERQPDGRRGFQVDLPIQLDHGRRAQQSGTRTAPRRRDAPSGEQNRFRQTRLERLFHSSPPPKALPRDGS
ncbi:hypothetical protein SXANM310S_03829 [Streptomyces xanthochromogenes]